MESGAFPLAASEPQGTKPIFMHTQVSCYLRLLSKYPMCMDAPRRSHCCNMQKYFLGVDDPQNSLRKFSVLNTGLRSPRNSFHQFFLMVSLRISNLKICIFKLCLCVWGGMGGLGGSRYMYAQAPSEARSIGSSWSYSR